MRMFYVAEKLCQTKSTLWLNNDEEIAGKNSKPNRICAYSTNNNKMEKFSKFPRMRIKIKRDKCKKNYGKSCFEIKLSHHNKCHAAELGFCQQTDTNIAILYSLITIILFKIEHSPSLSAVLMKCQKCTQYCRVMISVYY